MVWLLEIEGRLQIAQGRFHDAIATYKQLEAFGTRIQASVARWRAIVGIAVAMQKMGNPDAALARYEAAEALLDETIRADFRGGDEALLVDARDSVARQQATLLVRRNRIPQAVEVLNRHAARARRGLERGFQTAQLQGERRRQWERTAMRYQAMRAELDQLDGSSWRAPVSSLGQNAAKQRRIKEKIQSELDAALSMLEPRLNYQPRRVSPDETHLTFDRLGDTWLAYGTNAVGSHHVEVKLDAKAAPLVLAQQLLEPFSALLEGRSRLHIVARGASGTIDFHALPWRGKPLVESFLVTYGTDAPAVQRSADEAAQNELLIVADPRGNLPNARDEAAEVEQRWQDKGWNVTSLVARSVTRSRLLDALTDVTFLYWAGHGHPDAEAGFSASLPLNGRSVLGVGDILALTRIPSKVILSGCETAPPATTEIGPARAFVLAGSSEVVATTRRVRDEDAQRLGTMLAAARNEGATGHLLAKALRSAQIAAHRVNPKIDWAAFRAFTP